MSKLVWMTIKERMGKNGFSFAGLGRMATDLDMSVDTVRRSVRELQKSGLVVVTPGPRGRRDYKAIWPTDLPLLETSLDPSQIATPSKNPPLAKTSLDPSQKPRSTPSKNQPELHQLTKPINQLAAEPRARNPMFDALVGSFGNPAPSQASFYGKVATELLSLGAAPADIAQRVARYKADKTYSRCACTPGAVLKHWNELAPPIATTGNGPTPFWKSEGYATHDAYLSDLIGRTAKRIPGG